MSIFSTLRIIFYLQKIITYNTQKKCPGHFGVRSSDPSEKNPKSFDTICINRTATRHYGQVMSRFRI